MSTPGGGASIFIHLESSVWTVDEQPTTVEGDEDGANFVAVFFLLNATAQRTMSATSFERKKREHFQFSTSQKCRVWFFPRNNEAPGDHKCHRALTHKIWCG
jgi:hypothetical protein